LLHIERGIVENDALCAAAVSSQQGLYRPADLSGGIATHVGDHAVQFPQIGIEGLVGMFDHSGNARRGMLAARGPDSETPIHDGRRPQGARPAPQGIAAARRRRLHWIAAQLDGYALQVTLK
jgi:hypothetical protein